MYGITQLSRGLLRGRLGAYGGSSVEIGSTIFSKTWPIFLSNSQERHHAQSLPRAAVVVAWLSARHRDPV